MIKNMAKKVGAGLATGSAFVGSQAMAAIDVAAVGTEISAAGDAASSTGTLVIAAVAAIAGVGLIIGLIRKI
ncbi:hypothetical protein CLV44_11613 [Marinobacterium halophilum]|uniref:Virion coat protein B n=1 Tax=Marinobacterium halophilum TaxID=267374 RepID=A0A2P8ET94_9GAMM|nr:major capsid protein [Marinobacterium halophilum]PSL12655.1 hypothetical protein CLV44_11613 [Marinobacterium halophilum]